MSNYTPTPYVNLGKFIDKCNEPFTDDTIMPFGKHKGKHLKDVPDDYLLYMYNNGIANGKLFDYIKDNLDSLDK